MAAVDDEAPTLDCFRGVWPAGMRLDIELGDLDRDLIRKEL